MDELIPLSNQSLARLRTERPRYDRSALTPGIVHIGVGNFHRAHQAWYLHRLMQSGEALDWGIIGAGVRAYDAKMREKLLAQDCLTTLIQLEPDNISAEVIGPMIDYLPIEDDNKSLISAMVDPRIRIVSTTVTEGGYYIDPATTGFDSAHADIQNDAKNPRSPRTAFGAMVEALRIRRGAGHGPFTAQSCDNLQGNGAILRQTVVSLARLSDPDLANWIFENVSFPNSMVDCIAPAIGDNELELVRNFGIDDAAPVTHEPFRQWVMEDDFCAGRPEWDKVGATFSDNVHAYETMKIRILNGGHQIVSNVGELLSLDTILDCMSDPLISGFFRKVAINEIVPHVELVPEISPTAYVELVESRFSNPRIVDTTRRVAFDGSSRHPGFVIPSIGDGLRTGTSISGLALVEAIWARMCEGTREDGSQIEPNDPFWDDLQRVAKTAMSNPSDWLSMQNIYGEVADNQTFARAFGRWLAMIWDDGVEAAIANYCAEEFP